jgi:hypothetical protein
MRAGEIVCAVEAELRRAHRRRITKYRREWSIDVGGTRVDVAAINGSITGCEIKSCRDNFGRLDRQVRAYSAVMDSAVLVVEGRAASRAMDLVPEWWGVWQASAGASGAARLEVLRPTVCNPQPVPLAIAQLLWRGDVAGLRTATRWRLWEALAVQLPLDQLRREVRNKIKARRGW